MSFENLLTLGTILQGRYVVGRSIGYGGMGAVYETTDRRLDKRQALKQILRSTPQLREAFEREARLLARLEHQALPQVSDYFSEASSDFIVMDFIEGDDLSQILQRQGALPVEQALQWADQLLDVLIYLHTRRPEPVIHRDIKPQNIKCTEHGRLILLDFGIAKGSGSQTSTDRSVPAWTPHYAAPEQFLRSGTDARSDLYSLAATLYHLLSNQRPPAVDVRLAAAHNGQPDPLQPVQRVNSRVLAALGDLLHRTMSLHAASRPSSAAELRAELQSLGRTFDARPPAPDATEVTELSGPSAVDVPHASVQPRPPTPPAVSIIQPWSPGRSQPATEVERRHGQMTLQKRIYAEVRRTLDSYPGAWMVWCDGRGEWRPLLERVAADERMGGFPLLVVAGRTTGELGGPQARQAVQDRLDAGESFVLLLQAPPDRLGWMWAQALLAERRYDKTLREQLLEWGWRPQSPHVGEDDLAVLARQGLQQDPAAWGGGGLQPDLPLLLEVLAGGAQPDTDQAYVLTLTIEQAGLPAYRPQESGRWRVQSLARLLLTHAHALAPRLVAETNELLIAEGQRQLALELLTRWVDSLRLSKHLPEAVLEADKIAALGGQVAEATIKHGPFLSRAAEQTVFANTCARLAQKSGKELLQALVGMRNDIERHTQGFWSDLAGRLNPALVIPWSELLRLCRAAQQLLDAGPSQEWATPDAAIAWYTGGGWQLDVANEEILRNLDYSSPELLALLAPLRDASRSRWERSLIQWSDLWSAAGCPTPRLDTAGSWLAQQLASPRATAILVIDALRYDLGARLVTLINDQEGAQRATLVAARAPLPSITALGMGAALPIVESNLRAELAGSEWRLIEISTQTNLSVAEQRRAWLRQRGIVPDDGFITVADALHGRIPAPAKSRPRIFIADDIIDRLGHDDELEMLGTSIAIERYRDLVIHLRDAGWRQIVIVTDHGFIQWSGSAEKRLTPPSGAAYRSRRALAFPLDTPLADAHALTPGGQWKVLAARGASAWSAYGGLGYFHGGASLQEWIIPCIQVEWPSQARPVGVSIQALKHILSARPKVTLNVERGSIFIEDALPRYVIVVILHAQQRIALFRSEQIEINPAQEQVAVTLRLTPGATAEWDAPLRIEVRDALTEAVLAEAPSTLRTRLDEW